MKIEEGVTHSSGSRRVWLCAIKTEEGVLTVLAVGAGESAELGEVDPGVLGGDVALGQTLLHAREVGSQAPATGRSYIIRALGQTLSIKTNLGSTCPYGRIPPNRT